MRELQAKPRAPMAAAKLDHTAHRRFGLVRVQTDAVRSDPPLRLDVRHFGHHQPRAGEGEVSEVHQVPVAHAAVLRAVLAHRRDDDSVRELQPADRE